MIDETRFMTRGIPPANTPGRAAGAEIARCACGALTVSPAAPPLLVALCHCYACQLSNGRALQRERVLPQGGRGDRGTFHDVRSHRRQRPGSPNAFLSRVRLDSVPVCGCIALLGRLGGRRCFEPLVPAAVTVGFRASPTCLGDARRSGQPVQRSSRSGSSFRPLTGEPSLLDADTAGGDFFVPGRADGRG